MANYPKDVVVLWGTMVLSSHDIAEAHPYTDFYTQDVTALMVGSTAKAFLMASSVACRVGKELTLWHR